MNRSSRLCAWLAAFAVLPAFSAALAQDYPARPVRVIATSSAGGTSDIFMRALADELHKAMGQPFIVENRPGGAFNIGARACAEAPPDGYTLCIIPGEPLAFDPENGFEPITQLFFITQALVVSAALDVKTLPELIALSKAKPGTLSYSTAAVPLGVFIERLKRDTGADLVRVPFRGGGEAVTALLNGSTPVGFYGIANVRAQLEGGTVIGLLVDSDKRSPLFPGIPTIPEATQKTFAGRSYFGLLAPARTPKPIVARLQQEIARIVGDAGFRNRNLIERGLEPVASTPEAFARFIREDRAASELIVKESGLQPQ
jgi:tripartite-type tricarboxylate transporter receptor subunit TctC